MNRWDYYDDAGESNPPLHRSTLLNKEIMDPLPFPEVGTWRKFASCRHEDTTTFFATGLVGHNKEVRQKRQQAVEICQGCPVALQCLRYAVKNDIRWGVWGGRDMQPLKKIERIKLRNIFNK
jgi:WhiB family redox-sensing transcriptional regulator